MRLDLPEAVPQKPPVRRHILCTGAEIRKIALQIRSFS
jgi:hypothetical protein